MRRLKLNFVVLARRVAPSKPTFHRLHLHTIFDKYKLQVALFLFDVLNGTMLHLLKICLNVNSEIHGYFTRTANNLHINTVRTSTRKSTSIYSGLEIWNNIPLLIRNSGYLNQFKSALKLLLLNVYLFVTCHSTITTY